MYQFFVAAWTFLNNGNSSRMGDGVASISKSLFSILIFIYPPWAHNAYTTDKSFHAILWNSFAIN